MKKVAVLLSGHIRSYDVLLEVVNGLKSNLLKTNANYQFKFFIHTWDKLDWFRGNSNIHSNIHTDKNQIFNIIDVEDILIGSNPNPIVINGNDRISGQYLSVYRCNELKKKFEEQNYKFDISIRTRLDLKICEPIDLSSLDYSCYNITNDHFGFADWFCISSTELMDYYSDTILSLEKLVEQVNDIQGFVPSIGPDPHTILQMHLKNKGHELKKSDLDDLDIHNSLYDKNLEVEKYINRIDFLYYLIRSDGRPNETFKKGYR
jgi:hypothetical protein